MQNFFSENNCWTTIIKTITNDTDQPLYLKQALLKVTTSQKIPNKYI